MCSYSRKYKINLGLYLYVFSFSEYQHGKWGLGNFLICLPTRMFSFCHQPNEDAKQQQKIYFFFCRENRPIKVVFLKYAI